MKKPPIKTPLIILILFNRCLFHSETTPSLNMLVSSQVKRAIQSLAEATPRSREDASIRKMNSKRQLSASEAPSKFSPNLSLILVYFLNRFKADQRAFDKTRPNFFRGYGKTTMLAPHPCLNEEWSTSFRKTYLKPNTRTKPNAHTQLPVQEIEHDNALTKSSRASTIASGF